MGVTLATVHAILGVTFLITFEILIGCLLPTFLDVKDSYDEMFDRGIDQIKTDIEIIGISSAPDVGQIWNNSVESNSTDVDSSPDKGIETNFANAQDTGPDSNVMTIQEEFTGVVSEWLDCNSFTDEFNPNWTTVGSYPYLDAQDHPTNYIYSTNDNRYMGWFGFPSTTLTGILTVNISIYCNNDDGPNNDRANVSIDYTGSGGGNNVGEVAMHTAWQYDTIDLGSHTSEEVNNTRVFFEYDKNGPGASDDVRIDHVRLGVSHVYDTYELDFEYNWTNARFSKDFELVCIYVDSHIGSEILNVNYWNGSSWISLGTISSTGWTNLTAIGLDSKNYTIQLIGANESGDSSQDSWGIDCIFLRTWNETIITVKNEGSTILETDDFDILLNGVLTTFTCQKSYIYINDQANFSVPPSISDETIVKVVASNGISDYEKYIDN